MSNKMDLGDRLRSGNGWLRDDVDPRDYMLKNQVSIKNAVKKRIADKNHRTLPQSQFITEYEKLAIKKQLDTDTSCTAQAAVSLLEYCCLAKVISKKRKNGVNAKQFSVSFVYKCGRAVWAAEYGYSTSRSLQKLDNGCQSRMVMKAMALFGAPPENVHPYNTRLLRQIARPGNPDAYCYAYAQNFQAVTYYRLDDQQGRGQDLNINKRLVKDIKQSICADVPAMFSMDNYQSLAFAKKTGEVQFKRDESQMAGGHAMFVVGYDDKKRIGQSVGAFHFQNSCGDEWGRNGRGWLPYDYVLNGRTFDWWCLIAAEDIDEEVFVKRRRLGK